MGDFDLTAEDKYEFKSISMDLHQIRVINKHQLGQLINKYELNN